MVPGSPSLAREVLVWYQAHRRSLENVVTDCEGKSESVVSPLGESAVPRAVSLTEECWLVWG